MRKLHPILLTTLLAVALSWTGCDSGEPAVEQALPDDLFVETADIGDRLSRKAVGKAGHAAATVLELAGSLTPPRVSGQQLSATEVAVLRTNVYIGYGSTDESVRGGLDVLRAKDPTNTGVAKSYQSDVFELKSLAQSSTFQVNLGGTFAEEGTGFNAESPALILRVNGAMKVTHHADLSSLAVTDVDLGVGNTVLATTGPAGGELVLMSSTLAVLDARPSADARSVLGVGDYAFVLSGSGDVTRYELTRNDLTGSQLLTNVGPLPSGAIARLALGNTDELLVPLNDRGLAVVNGILGDVTGIQTEVVGPEVAGPVTQGLQGDRGLYFMASASRGVVAIRRSEGGPFETVQIVELEGDQANLIASDGDFVYVAAGSGGMSILKILD